ncbi:MAG: CGNR zinc finger domain-containing protein [Pseudolysinimonas sp.]
MLFAPDTEDTLEFLVELVNTAPLASRSGRDELPDPLALTALLTRHSYSGRFDRDAAELASVIDERAEFRGLWDLTGDELVVAINDMMHSVSAVPYLVKHDGFDWHLHATPPDAPLAERMRVEVALALVDVVRTASQSRMRVCAADNCDGVLVDFSRNGSKQYCSVRCGNRMNQVAYRERAAE